MIRTTSTRALVATARGAGVALVVTLLGVAGWGAGCHSGDDQKDVGHGVLGPGACAMSCGTAADCAAPGAPPAFDASHFACTNGVCQYTGCKSDQECTATNGQGWACRTTPGIPQPACVATCGTAADCTQPDAPAHVDASHFACTNGVCEYLGCKNDQECTTMNGAGWTCRTPPGAARPTCMFACSAATDCAVPNGPAILDASHFACTDGVCEHLGCKNDQECVAVAGQGAVCK